MHNSTYKETVHDYHIQYGGTLTKISPLDLLGRDDVAPVAVVTDIHGEGEDSQHSSATSVRLKVYEFYDNPHKSGYTKVSYHTVPIEAVAFEPPEFGYSNTGMSTLHFAKRKPTSSNKYRKLPSPDDIIITTPDYQFITKLGGVLIPKHTEDFDALNTWGRAERTPPDQALNILWNNEAISRAISADIALGINVKDNSLLVYYCGYVAGRILGEGKGIVLFDWATRLKETLDYYGLKLK